MDITEEESSPLNGFPWLKPSAFMAAMAKMNDVGHLLGGYSLEQSRGRLLHFWNNYRKLYPSHQLWCQIDGGQKRLEDCVPVLLHGDEGVTYKKQGLLVLSFQGIIGFGCSKRDLPENQRARHEQVPLNFLRAFDNRCLMLVCPKDCSCFVVGISLFLN